MTPLTAAALPPGTTVLYHELRGNWTSWTWTGMYHKKGGFYRAVVERDGKRYLKDLRRLKEEDKTVQLRAEERAILREEGRYDVAGCTIRGGHDTLYR